MRECSKCGFPAPNGFLREKDYGGRLCPPCFDELPIKEQKRFFDVTGNPNPSWDRYLNTVADRLGWSV